MRFKLQVIAVIARGWKWASQYSRVQGWLQKSIDAIDAVLNSLIAAAGDISNLIKEFKDALTGLAGER